VAPKWDVINEEKDFGGWPYIYLIIAGFEIIDMSKTVL
jgi:hypothetical protein